MVFGRWGRLLCEMIVSLFTHFLSNPPPPAFFFFLLPTNWECASLASNVSNWKWSQCLAHYLQLPPQNLSSFSFSLLDSLNGPQPAEKYCALLKTHHHFNTVSQNGTELYGENSYAWLRYCLTSKPTFSSPLWRGSANHFSRTHPAAC